MRDYGFDKRNGTNMWAVGGARARAAGRAVAAGRALAIVGGARLG